MSKKRKAKIKLPTDRHGTPIHIGDVLMWDDGTTIRVETLTYYGDEFDALGFRWTANEEGTSDEDSSDNLEGSEIIWKSK